VKNGFKERWSGHAPILGESSPFGVTADGCQDYRGAPISHVQGAEGLLVEGCDFSDASFRNLRMAGCSFKNSIFDSADMSHISIRSSEFANCRFQKTDLKLAQVGITGSKFNRCIFEHVRVARAGFHNPVFEDMVFDGPDWRSVDFRASGFWNCAFKGDVRGVVFRGDYQLPVEREINGPPGRTGLHNVSFADAELFWVGFTNGCLLVDITLPRSGSAFICNVSPLLNFEHNLTSLYPAEVAERAAKYFEIVRVYAPLQPVQIVSRNDLVDRVGPDNGPKLFELLKREFGHSES
jgi:uncharacterized protein YjbI with pentapeptide repeats